MYRRWRVYSTFLTGLAIGLAYALLVGNLFGVELVEEAEGLYEWQVLVLVFTGILGGVIYQVVAHGQIEMPRFVEGHRAIFKAGLFGDILLGIAGACLLSLLIPEDWSAFENPELGGRAIAAVGIIGGYGGRAIVQFSLERFFKLANGLGEPVETRTTQKEIRPNEVVITESEPAARTESLGETDDALALIAELDRYIQLGGSQATWTALSQRLKASVTGLHGEILTAMQELRQMVLADEDAPVNGALVTEFEQPQWQRLIQVVQALVQQRPKTPEAHYLLGLLWMDLTPPDYTNAVGAFDQAIAYRGALTAGQPWEYELQRAVARILLTDGEAVRKPLTGQAIRQSAIIDDLRAIAQIYNLETLLKAKSSPETAQAVLGWLGRHRAVLAEDEQMRSLLASSGLLTPTAEANWPRDATSSGVTPGLETQPVSLPTGSPPEPANPQGILFPEIYRALGQCYDLLELDPFNISGSGKSARVFTFYPGEAKNKLDEGETLWVPLGAEFVPGSRGSLAATTQTKLLYTESDIQRLFASTLGNVVTRLLGAVLPFSFSASYGQFRQERETERSVYAFTKAEYVDYELVLQWDRANSFHLDQGFFQAVTKLPLHADYKYFEFVDMFGTHVSNRVAFGGLMHHRLRLSQRTYASAIQHGANIKVEAKKLINAKYGKRREGSTYREISESSESMRFCGGMPQDTIYDWFKTVKADPAPIHLDLMPIDELLEPLFFPNDVDIEKKRSLLNKEIQIYLEKNSQRSLWELWPSMAAGGGGGKPFADMNLAPALQEENQLRYKTARVSEVRVWIQNWIERVQLVLEGAAAPLEGHGSEDGGTLNILPLDSGDYIAGISINVGSPQKILGFDRGTFVGALTIKTHLGKVWTVGTENKERAINLDIPEDYQVIGFHGRCGRHIDKLGVISMPAPNQNDANARRLPA